MKNLSFLLHLCHFPGLEKPSPLGFLPIKQASRQRRGHLATAAANSSPRPILALFLWLKHVDLEMILGGTNPPRSPQKVV